jgi:hypothetical protein
MFKLAFCHYNLPPPPHTHMRENQSIERKDLFWLTILEVSVHVWASCFWVCGKAAHHGGEYLAEQSCSPHG